MKKLALILGAVGAGFLLVGGVVAAYVINDNANKSGITITPGEITEDKTGTVTLSWGEMTQFTNIEGLAAGTPVTRTVNVKAELKNEAEEVQNAAVYQGKLDVELKDLSGKTAEAAKLIDYLTVTVKGFAYTDGNFAENKSELGSITPDSSKLLSVPLYSNKDGKAVDFIVSLDVAATPVMASINTDRVYLSVDWNRGDAAEGVKHVYIPDNGWENMYVYSYSAGKENKAWPGVQLERDSKTGLFVADLLAHDYFIFNDGAGNQYPAAGLDGMTAESIAYSTANAIYFNWNTHKFVAEAPQTLAPFYLLGETTVWDVDAGYAFEAKDVDLPEGVAHQWYLDAEVEAGKEYKFRSGDGNIWLGADAIEQDCRALISGDNNYTFNYDGEYEMYIKEYSAGGHSVYLSRVGGIPQPQVATYYLLGNGNWDTLNDNIKFALAEENLPENLEHQWHFQATVEANQEFKIRCGENENEWHGLSEVEAPEQGQDALVGEGEVPSDGNFKFLAAGTYDIYLKKGTDGGFSIYIGAVNQNP